MGFRDWIPGEIHRQTRSLDALESFTAEPATAADLNAQTPAESPWQSPARRDWNGIKTALGRITTTEAVQPAPVTIVHLAPVTSLPEHCLLANNGLAAEEVAS